MMGLLRFAFATAMLGLMACGGAVESTEPDTTTPSTLSQASVPWGRWDLVSLVNTDARAATTEVFGQLQIDALPGGQATARRCLMPHYEPGSRHLRCADASAYDCLEGKLEWDGAHWRFAFASLTTQGFPAQGVIARVDDGDLIVRNPIGTQANGRFMRVVNNLDDWKCPAK
jgi:hypothetical protein